jgi:hypothetical protein
MYCEQAGCKKKPNLPVVENPPKGIKILLLPYHAA